MKLLYVLPVLVLFGVALSGCLGGDSGGNDEPEYEVFTANVQLNGRYQSDEIAQATDVDTEASIPINLDFDNVIMIQANITIEDGDDQTNPDSIGQITLAESEEGNYTGQVNGGNTPAEKQIVIEWDDENYMGSSWTLTVPGTLKASDNMQVPGIILWRGYPDSGFSWILDITYDYHGEPSEE